MIVQGQHDGGTMIHSVHSDTSILLNEDHSHLFMLASGYVKSLYLTRFLQVKLKPKSSVL